MYYSIFMLSTEILHATFEFATQMLLNNASNIHRFYFILSDNVEHFGFYISATQMLLYLFIHRLFLVSITV